MDVRSYRGQFSVWGFLAMGLLMVCGCAPGGNDGKPGDTNSDDQNASQSAGDSASLNPEKLLVGTWYGKAQLNQELLQTKLNSIADPVQREMLLNLARTFETTEIGAEFSANGLMVLDIQVRTGGQLLRDSSRGTWKTRKVEGNAIFVETTEPLPQGGTETNQIRYQFQGGDVAVMVAPTSQQLADCNPLFVFERIQPAEVADAANPGNMK